MGRIWLAAIWLVLFNCGNTWAQSTSLASISCILPANSLCTSGFLTTANLSPYQHVTAAGYYSPGDGGGGEFEKIAHCDSYSTSGNTTAGKTRITGVGLTTNLAVGSLINDSSGGTIIPTNDQVLSFTSNTITLSVPAIGTATSASLTITGHNGGTLLQDSAGPADCFVRVSSNWSPKEWGAFEDGIDDDADALQRWLNAVQPHVAVPGNSIIKKPVICYDGGIIQGSPSEAVAENNQYQPTFLITADNTGGGFNHSGTTYFSMLEMYAGARCAIHAVGLIADGTGEFDTLHADGTADLVDGHSYLYGGRYNLITGSTAGGDLQIYDSSLNVATIDNANITSSNVKLVRNSFAGAGQNNITFKGSDAVITDNIIQETAGWGIDLQNARQARITANYFDNDGNAVAGTGALMILNSGSIPICGNTFHRTGAATEGSGVTAHIYFAGTDDSISLCGNTYLPGVVPDTVTTPASAAPVIAVRPDYVYDADPSAFLSNIVIADNPAPQNIGPDVFSPNALLLLKGALSGRPEPNFLTGLTLQNVGLPSPKIMINPGSAVGTAVDSSNAALITLQTSCPVDLSATNGLGALDQGSVHQNTTYYVFVVSGPGGANPNCMASASLTPTFKNTGNVFKLKPPGNTVAGSTIVWNVGGPAFGDSSAGTTNPLGGMAVGDFVTGSGVSSGTTIAGLSSFYLVTTGTVNSGTTPSVTGMASVMNVAAGMLVGNPLCSPTTTSCYIAAGTTILSVCTSSACTPSAPTCTPTPCITLSQPPYNTSTSAVPVTIGGNYTITLSASATNLYTQTPIAVQAGRYRMVGAIYTNPSDTNVVAFTQDEDTFYLATPRPDVNTGSLGNTDTALALASVPNGISVEWLGRCVSNAKVIVYSLGQVPGQPVAFPTSPGYDALVQNTQTAEKYRTYTDTSQHIHARASGASTTLQCMTDGWAWHRGR